MDWHQDWFGITQWHQDWFGVTADSALPGYGPEGVAAFSLDLENSYTVTYKWVTDIIKTRSGKEQRISRNDHPKESYRGSIILFGDAPAELRAQMARFAAQGKTFTLGLPHEEMSARLASSGTTYYVHSTTGADWMNAGQRVIVRNDGDAVEAVIQSTTPDSIVLDVEPDDIGGIGSTIMPSMPIYLEPEQAFPRYPTEAERWEIQARAAVFDFARGLATLALGPLTAAAGLDNATVTARVAGSTPTIRFISTAIVTLTIAESGNDVTVYFVNSGTPTTPAQLYTALQSSTLLAPTGTWGSGDLSVADDFAATALTGGATAGPIGTGATLTTYLTRPVWDAKLDNDSTATDSIQAMTEIIDYDGLPYAIGSADMADWGRSVGFHGTHGYDWQWFKLFMATVKGRQKAFWLPTWRDDLPFLSKSTNVITVAADVGAWWPLQRQHVQILETSGTITRAQVTVAVDHGDGTWTLTIGTTLATSSVEMVSWLELVRFTQDEFQVTFDQYGFDCPMVATAVQQ